MPHHFYPLPPNIQYSLKVTKLIWTDHHQKFKTATNLIIIPILSTTTTIITHTSSVSKTAQLQLQQQNYNDLNTQVFCSPSKAARQMKSHGTVCLLASRGCPSLQTEDVHLEQDIAYNGEKKEQNIPWSSICMSPRRLLLAPPERWQYDDIKRWWW